MGCLSSKQENDRILMLGLDAAGKTTTLSVMKGEKDAATVPTVGFNVERIKYDGHQLAIYDLGGQDTTRSLWQHYYNGIKAIIFVIDCSDHNRIAPIENDENDEEEKKEKIKTKYSATAKEELLKLLNESELKHCKNYLIYANKQDLHNALNPFDLEAKLQLKGFEDTNMHFQACSAKNGQGINDGLSWLIDVIYNDK